MDREVVKLTRVLREIAHDAGFAMIYRSAPDTAAFCAGQYNRVVRRLQALDADAFASLPLLPQDAPPARIRMTARDAAWCVALQNRKRKIVVRGGCVHPMVGLFPMWGLFPMGGLFKLEGS